MFTESRKIVKAETLFLLITGLIMGTVFTFGVRYWNAPIVYDEAQQVSAIFSSFKERKRHGRIQEIILQFDDHEQLYIDGACVDDELCDAIGTIDTGANIEMKVHPNSNTILEMKVGADEFLAFQDSVQKLSSETSGFFVAGVFCYIAAIVGAYQLIRLKKQYRYNIQRR